MHGRPRKAPKPEDTAASAAKAEKLRALQSQLLHNHHNQIYTKEALEISAKLLEANPESYTAWNYRKLAVEHNLSQSESDPDTVKSIFSEELRVVESSLKQNFKSYGAWHHRKWVLSKGHSSVDHELQLLDRFQRADSRNFHAWNYRRFIAALKGIPDEEELKYTTKLIETNFSNYSAWHNRSVLLSHLLQNKVKGFFPKEKVLVEEYEFVHQALFTDPDDQSGWFYHLWLLDQTVKPETPLLVSTWPVHGSDIIVSAEGCLDGRALSPFTSFHSDAGTFPLILYFNEAVEGVNSSTVTVKSVFTENKDLVWKPLATSKSCAAQAWVTHLNVPDVKLHPSTAYPIEVNLGDSQGIVSLSGSHCSHPSRFAFTVCVQPLSSKHAERQSVEMILWRDVNFHFYDAHVQESSPIAYFDRLSIKKDREPAASKWHAKTLVNEIALVRQLLSEIDCKIGKLTLARLLMAHDAMMSYMAPHSHKKVHSEEVLQLYSDLMELDPMHSQYYKEAQSLVLLQQVTSNRESLLKHCCHHRVSTSSSVGNSVCLRLNNLSLSRIGCVEQLLWVQMLDLSHNELRSIDGLEAMQLLSFLNLSHNKLSSFTALEPLRLLKLLKVLDISYNEIGAHPVDTRRYLCSSPLSHTVGSDWNFNEFVPDDAKVTNYWEAFAIFRGFNLTQLDIVGNAITDEKFKSFLIKVLPTLKWVDGEESH
ncbi:geranylgeranyl transferase type-2 subunit alpha 1 [Vitis riparia]|uniref:geranylgeranyl transferase type-2 subunit alpha 1 n=1 Tax=Vitis riparia TaxID=96939 RepID=UPI00155B24E8|nr:geranylgeranyl transferase type-2 subunit alpha 1 [Vitis riparia]